MDVKAYYEKIRSIESRLPQGEVVVVSLDTSDGGRAGRVMELSRQLAAKMIADQRARVASDEEAAMFHAQVSTERSEIGLRRSEPRTHFVVDRDAEKPVTKGKK